MSIKELEHELELAKMRAEQPRTGKIFRGILTAVACISAVLAVISTPFFHNMKLFILFASITLVLLIYLIVTWFVGLFKK